MKSILVAIVGILSFVYLINPTAGIFEILPDNIPLVGNVDEVTATTLLLSALAYFGIDISHLFKRESREVKTVKEAEYEEKKERCVFLHQNSPNKHFYNAIISASRSARVRRTK